MVGKWLEVGTTCARLLGESGLKGQNQQTYLEGKILLSFQGLLGTTLLHVFLSAYHSFPSFPSSYFIKLLCIFSFLLFFLPSSNLGIVHAFHTFQLGLRFPDKPKALFSFFFLKQIYRGMYTPVLDFRRLERGTNYTNYTCKLGENEKVKFFKMKGVHVATICNK